MRPLSLLSLLALLACSTVPESDVTGHWGGTQASMNLTFTGGTVNYQCGNGTIDAGWSLSSTGAWHATGQHYFGGGPVPPNGGTPHPATYDGYVDGDHFNFTVVISDPVDTLGPFQMTRGGGTVVMVCL